MYMYVFYHLINKSHRISFNLMIKTIFHSIKFVSLVPNKTDLLFQCFYSIPILEPVDCIYVELFWILINHTHSVFILLKLQSVRHKWDKLGMSAIYWSTIIFSILWVSRALYSDLKIWNVSMRFWRFLYNIYAVCIL